MDDLEIRTKTESVNGTHMNTVTLQGPNLQKVRAISGSVVITDGQDIESGPMVAGAGGSWSIDLDCGRHKSKLVADKFKGVTRGEYHMFAPNGGSLEGPKELNFFYEAELTINAKNYTIWLAQGSFSSTNNWWIGGECIAYTGGTTALIQPSIVISGGTSDFYFMSTS